MSVEEVGRRIEDIFVQRVAAAAGSIATALAQIEDAHRQLTALTAGSGQERAGDLNDIFAKIAGDISAVAAGIHMSEEVKAGLFAAWGFVPAPVASVASTETATNTGSGTNTPEATVFSSPQELLVDVEDLEDDGSADDQTIAARIASVLKWADINTLRDVVLFGTDGLRATRSMGEKRIDWIVKQVTDRMPGLEVSEKPDPVLAAKLCASLAEVPAHIFDPKRQLLPKLSHFTTDEILNMPFSKIIKIIWGGSAPRPGSYAYEDARKSYNTLRRRAELYSAKFLEAKQQQ